MVDLQRVTHEDFKAYLNHRFVIELEETSPVELELVSVETRTNAGAADGRRQAFSLVFRGPQTPALEQSTFAMANDRLGSMGLFLVPIAEDETGRLYEAIFN